jgi:hypothetical protein
MNLVIPGSTRISPRQQWQALNSGKYRLPQYVFVLFASQTGNPLNNCRRLLTAFACPAFAEDRQAARMARYRPTAQS